MNKRTMKIKHVTTWGTAFLLMGVGATLVLHSAHLIATPSDAMMLSPDLSHDQPMPPAIEITTKAMPPDSPPVPASPEVTAIASATTYGPGSDKQIHAQETSANRDPGRAHGTRYRWLRVSGTWLFPPAQSSGGN